MNTKIWDLAACEGCGSRLGVWECGFLKVTEEADHANHQGEKKSDEHNDHGLRIETMIRG